MRHYLKLMGRQIGAAVFMGICYGVPVLAGLGIHAWLGWWGFWPFVAACLIAGAIWAPDGW